MTHVGIRHTLKVVHQDHGQIEIHVKRFDVWAYMTMSDGFFVPKLLNVECVSVL